MTLSDAQLVDAYGQPTVPGPDDVQWADVVPNKIDDNPEALASIMYPADYAQAIGYLRAVMLANEHSLRCLRLTSLVIDINPAHYTVWLYRFRIVRALAIPLEKEFAWLNEVALQHLKNYQIWHHRQSLLDLAIGNTIENEDSNNEKENKEALVQLATSEMEFLKTMLAEDAKNYHVWSYRHLLVRRLDLWPSSTPLGPAELAATMEFIDADVRNNSAWAHRFYLVFSDPAVSTPSTDTAPLPASAPDPRLPAELVDREISFALDHIRRAPQNQSAWSYLRGVLAKGGRPLSEVADTVEREFGAEGTGKEGMPASSHAVEVLAEHAESVGNVEAAGRYWDQMKVLDPVRGGYWDYRKARGVAV